MYEFSKLLMFFENILPALCFTKVRMCQALFNLALVYGYQIIFNLCYELSEEHLNTFVFTPLIYFFCLDCRIACY